MSGRDRLSSHALQRFGNDRHVVGRVTPRVARQHFKHGDDVGLLLAGEISQDSRAAGFDDAQMDQGEVPVLLAQHRLDAFFESREALSRRGNDQVRAGVGDDGSDLHSRPRIDLRVQLAVEAIQQAFQLNFWL
jgi:hypothetical protein